MNKIVCIDSNICIWGIKSEGDATKVANAGKFLSELEEKKIKMLLPMPVIIELLSHLRDDIQKNEILSLLDNRNIMVKPLDKIAALKCGELLFKTFTDEEIIKFRKYHKVEKAKIKYDCMIAAIAIVNKCDCIYTDNIDDLERYSHGQIKINGLPVYPVQRHLF